MMNEASTVRKAAELVTVIVAPNEGVGSSLPGLFMLIAVGERAANPIEGGS